MSDIEIYDHETQRVVGTWNVEMTEETEWAMKMLGFMVRRPNMDAAYTGP